MNNLEISVKKYLTYQTISQSLFNKFYNVISKILTGYDINECCSSENICNDDDSLDKRVLKLMYKEVLPTIYFNKVMFYVVTKLKCNNLGCCN
ncbi:MAG TPA: hypothetical protein PKD00_08775 [Burkholderiales bacterium]|nr:hypothetical protein [Burkholderiales bacterium]